MFRADKELKKIQKASHLTSFTPAVRNIAHLYQKFLSLKWTVYFMIQSIKTTENTRSKSF